MAAHKRAKKTEGKSTPKPLKRAAALLLTACAIAWFSWSGRPGISAGPAAHGSPEQTGLRESANLPRGERRGTIYDRNYRELAASLQMASVYAKPLELDSPEDAASRVAEALGLDAGELLRAISTERSFVYLAQELAPEAARQVEALGITGIYVNYEMKRFYPARTLAAHVLGFMKNDQGLDGIEFQHDATLGGRTESGNREPRDIVLTIDLQIQQVIEEQLAGLAGQTGAESGTFTVMDARSGAILASAAYPAFDPNSFWSSPAASRSNRLADEELPIGRLSRLFQAVALQEFNGLAAADAISGAPVVSTETPEAAGTEADIPLISPQACKKNMTFDPARADGAALAKLGQDLGLVPGNGPAPPLPLTDPGFTASRLELLQAVATIANNGQQIRPHFLDQILGATETQADQPGPQAAPPAPVLRHTSSQDVFDTLENYGFEGPAGAHFWQNFTPRIETAQSPEEPSSSSSGAAIPADATLVGVAPLDEPAIIMLLTLDNASLSPAVVQGEQASPLIDKLKPAAAPLLGLARRPAPPVPSQQERFSSMATLVNEWRSKSHASSTDQDFVSDVQFSMPDLFGKSLRQALRELQSHHLKITVVGNGRIINQHPRAGTVASRNGSCILELKIPQ